MIRRIKKIILSSLSILGISSLMWAFLLSNPNWIYSKSTTVENVTIYHNSNLEKEVESTVKKALKIISSSEIYKKENKIQLCLNDNSQFPNLHLFASGTAYAFLNKTVIFACTPKLVKIRLNLNGK